MNVLVILAVILYFLMEFIGGKKGARSFIAIFLNFGVILVTVLAMKEPAIDPVVFTLIASVVISCINLFYINEVNSKTKTAFLSTMITVVILLFFILILSDRAMIQGFGKEETEELGALSKYVGVDFVKIGASVIIMSTIGAITDTAIAISSPMRELFHHRPFVTRKELFRFGISIGKDILGTSTNTLFFAFFGSYLALLLLFKDLSYSWEEIINSKIFSAEMITILCSGIGVALIIPITAWINASYLIKRRDKQKVTG
ncbi:YibE/F family protein [Bacillus massilinigeriensis]|uniref:YibE/F family protein n=1 Tax=Bacillus mediterraneensis TaxID=1805474 RepID=UPI0008F8535E|nr:YibE/F family protein [Bacillus mediterraneensis]